MVASIWRTRDRLGRAVEFTAEAWDQSVLERTGEPPTIAAIRSAVESPDLVTADADFPRRECHYRWKSTAPLRLKVVVRSFPLPPSGTWVDEVVTAYSDRNAKPQEAPLWP